MDKSKHIRTFRSKKLHPEHAKLLNDAIRRNARGGEHDVHITYRKENGEVSKRKVRPLAVKGKSLFVAHCHERNAIRSFRVERIDMIKSAFWEGFEKKAKVGIRDVESHMGSFVDPKDVPKTKAQLDEANAGSFALRHPFLAGIPTLGIWPAMAKDRALDEIKGELMRNNPAYLKALKEQDALDHKREVELMQKHIAERDADAKENLMRMGSTAAVAGVGSLADAWAQRRRSQGQDDSEGGQNQRYGG